MKQILLEAPGSFALRKTQVPTMKGGEVLIRVEKVGVCGSDFHAFSGRHPIYTYPRVIGHEVSGTIVDIEANAQGLAIGDRCAVEPYLSCGSCRACIVGRNNCCENLKVLGVHIDGGLQEFLSVPMELIHCSKKLSLEQLALVETLGIGAHAVNRSGLITGEQVLVIGAGPIGIAVLQFAAARGAKVHMVETNVWRREFISSLGYPVSASAEGLTADIVFDATGNAGAMGASVAHVATGGRLVYVGLTKDLVSLDDALFHRREQTILASRNSFGLFPQIIKQIEDGEIDTSPWVTHRLEIDQVPDRFAALQSEKELVKAIINVNTDQSPMGPGQMQ